MKSGAADVPHQPVSAVGSHGRDRLGRSFGLDLMRGAAVLLVFQAHLLGLAGSLYGFVPPQASGLGGWLGVDLFFGLSGFLIGHLLLDIARSGRRPSPG